HEVTAGGESGMIAPDPDDHDIVYGDKVDKLDVRTNQTRNVDPTLAYPAAHYRGAWTLPLTFSKRGTKTLYFANQRLFRTTDGGDHWAPVSPDLTREDAGTPSNLDPVTAADDDHVSKRRGVIYSIAPSPLNAQALWVGTDDGLVWRTDDSGAHWRQVTPKALTPWSKIAGIELSPFDANVAYLAVDRHRLDDDTPYIYRTTDGGSSWQSIDGGIPRDSFVNVVRADPQRKGLLYAGTERGMVVSFDDGTQWQSLQQNLPMTSVRDIAIHGDDLVLATHGRGFWIMDDASALRQVADVHTDATMLFKPAQAYRVRPVGFTGTPLPKDEPTAVNPPDGAFIDYALPTSVEGPVTLDVLNAQGHTIRNYSSDDKKPMLDPAKLPFAPEWVPRPLRLQTTAGMHRFVWDLHYAAPAGIESERGAAEGVWAPPGAYSVVLHVGGKSYRQPLQLLPDPRVKVSVAAMQRQFVLAQKVQDAQVRAKAATDEAGKLLKALDARLGDGDGNAHADIAALISKAQDLSGVVLHPDPRNTVGSPAKNTDSLRATSMNLARLEQAVDGADADPGADAQSAWATLSQTLDATITAWTQLKQTDLTRLNSTLKANGKKPVAL
ncbi:MAG: hypothetical protein ABI178_15975, partial [Rhodanobacter sp.]